MMSKQKKKGMIVMVHKNRQEILECLKARRLNHEPILIAEAGIGLIAKMAEAGGIDLLIISSVADLRMKGLDDAAAYRPYGNCNDVVLNIATRLRKVVRDVPVIAGVGPGDPYKDIDEFIDSLCHIGISGITNIPSVGPYTPTYRRNVDEKGAGVPAEAEMIKRARKKGLLTIANSFYDSDAEEFARSGADMILINHRFSVEKVSRPHLYDNTELCCRMVQETINKIKAINPEVLTVVHGGTFDTFEKIRTLFETTDAD